MCRKDFDYIDFPCSPAWRDHYFRQGLTPTHSDEFHRSGVSEIRLTTMEEDIAEMKTLLRGKKVIVHNLISPPVKKPKEAFTRYEVI